MNSSSAPVQTTRSRVKLYTLNEDRQWDDRGTGFVTYVSPNGTTNQHSMIVKSEIDGSTLLESEIQFNTKYQKQQDTLIVWSEGENYDLALSFQEKIGCDEIWEKICLVQGRDASTYLPRENETGVDSVVDESDEECNNELNDRYFSSNFRLPPVDRSHLEEIRDLIRTEKVRDASRRELIARAIESENFIEKLFELFSICEKENDLESLHQLNEIVRSIIYLNKSSLFDILFREQFIWELVGSLEYEPKTDFQSKKNHREFLRNKANFKEVIPIGNQDLIFKIHQTYRVQYIHDAILPAPSLFEENLLSTMTTLLYFNKVEIVTSLYENPKFLNQLFSALRDEQISDEKRKDLMLFLKEFCVFSQTLQQQNRDQFFQALATHGILNVIQVILNLDDLISKQAALDVFASIVECNPSTVREYMLQETQSIQDDEELLLNLVITEIRSDPDPELSGALQLMNHLKLLIDPDNMLAVSISEKTEFLSFFYLRSMPVLLAPLMTNTIDDKLARDDFRIAQIENSILDFITFCLEHHTYHMRNFLNKKDVLRRILTLLKSKHQFLQLSALRFVRKMIGVKEEQYYSLIIRNNLFLPIVNAFKRNKRRYNLLNSALIEFFEFIRQEDITCLIDNFVENFYSDFHEIKYVKTFEGLKFRYDSCRDEKNQMLNSSSPMILNSSGFRSLTTSHLFSIQRLRKEQCDIDNDDEQWFQSENDDQPSSSTNSNGLFNSISDSDDDSDDERQNERTPSPVASSAQGNDEPFSACSPTSPSQSNTVDQDEPTSPVSFLTRKRSIDEAEEDDQTDQNRLKKLCKMTETISDLSSSNANFQ